MKTKIFSLCMALFAVMNLFAYDFYYDGFYYDIVGSDSVEVIDGDCQYAGNVVIPTTAYNGQDYYKVIGVGYKAFGGDSALISVTMGEHIKYIRSFAFAGSPSLLSISVSSNLQSCGSDLFNNCSKISVINITSNNVAELCNNRANSLLTTGSIWSIPRKIWINEKEVKELFIPDGITMIQDDAFRNCDDLMSVTIGNDVTHIGSDAFNDCDGISSVAIGNGITHIDEHAFYSCDNINSLSLGCSLEYIGKYSLTSKSIESITLTAESIDEYCNSTANNVLYNSYHNSVSYVPRNIIIDGKEINIIEIPKTVDTISERLFYNCDMLQKIVIPTGITHISDNAFNDCDSTTTIIIGENVSTIGNNAFYSCDLLNSVIIENGIRHIGNSCFSQCGNLSNITIGSSLEVIGYDFVRDCPLKHITLTSRSLEEYCNSITNKIIYKNGWAGSSAARKVVINDEEITSLNIPSSVDTISERLFWNCDDLTDVTIPNNTTYIAKNAFDESNNITNVTIGNGIKTIDEGAFRLCGKLTNLTIGASLAELGYAFYGTSITSITLSANTIDEYCKTIANNLLYKNSSYTQAPRTLLINGEEVTSLVIPNTVETISERLFWNCDGLTNVIILDSVKHIADYAFNESDNITTSTIGNGIISIGREAYKSCDHLLSVAIGANVATIGNTAFYNNYNLKEIICHAVIPPILDGLAFTPDVLSSVYIPCGTSDSYKASSWNSYCKNFVEPASEMTVIVQTADSIQGSVIVDQMPTCNNDTVIFHAIPNPLYEFIGWSDGNTENPRTLVVTQDMSLVAHFEIIYLKLDTVTLCYGETYQWHDKIYDASGVYIDTLSTGVATLYLTILPQVEETIEEAVICSDETYTWQANEKVYSESGIYTVILQDINGCDSVVILHLTVNPVATTEESVTACDSYTWNGQTYTASGDYTYTISAANGCDSIVTLHLTINNSEKGETDYATICYGESYTWNGKTYSANGEYSVTLSNTNGCDSVATLHLTIMPKAVTTTETVVVGSDELPYAWRGNTYTATGRYTIAEQYVSVSCDSAIHELNLTVLTTGNYDEQSISICETETPYLWYGEAYRTTGKYTYTEKYVGTDIDSIQHILNLTVNPVVYTDATITACDSYTWNGQTYTASGDYTYTTSAANGCDSIVTLHLTISKSAKVELSMVACDSYEWHGLTYSVSGDYTYTTTENGCDHVEILHLTILPDATTESEVLTLCSSELPYEWYGQTFSQEGTYTATEQYANAECDSVVHRLILQTYVQTLPDKITLPIVRRGLAIDVTIPTAEIQAYIAAETWYAPNTAIIWTIWKENEWIALTDEPVGEHVNEVELKYAVDSDCGIIESKSITIPVLTTNEQIVQTEDSMTRKILYDNILYILRNGKVYTAQGQEVN